jgi:hypothetical protein
MADAAPAALALVGAAAARGGQWPLASESFQLLTGRYPGYRTGREARLAYAEALYRTGALAEAQARLQGSSTHRPGTGFALTLLGRTHEAGGDAVAASTSKRVGREYLPPGVALLGTPRALLVGYRDEARPLLPRGAAGDGRGAEAAYRLGEARDAGVQRRSSRT